MVTNEKIINMFIDGLEKNKHISENVFIEKLKNGICVLYSYGYHFPLCIKLLDNTYLINSDGYSNTTARHKSLLCYALNNTNFKELQKQQNNNIMFFDTNQLKNILSMGFKTKLEIIQNKI